MSAAGEGPAGGGGRRDDPPGEATAGEGASGEGASGEVASGEATSGERPADGGGHSRVRATYDGFALALRIMYMLYAPDAPASEVGRPWEVIKEIAQGKLSLSNPADLAARFPGMRELVFDTANQVMARERETAVAVLEGMQEAL